MAFGQSGLYIQLSFSICQMGEWEVSSSGISTWTKKTINGLGLVVHVFNLALRRQEDLCEFSASLVYIISSRIVRTM